MSRANATQAPDSLRSSSTLSMADQAYEELRDRLILLDIPPGSAIVESRLSTELGVGRTPIREALKRLEGDHLVQSFPRRGTFATAVDMTQLVGISQMRRLLVPLAARSAAEVRGGTAAEPLAHALTGIGELSNEEPLRDLMAYDLHVHRLINIASQNPHLEETLIRLDSLVARMWCALLDRLPYVVEHIREHAALLAAILDGDAGLAQRLATEHVAHFEDQVRAVL